jgi:hypothetical protein
MDPYVAQIETPISYRTLDRSRNEIRLLRILPPTDDAFIQPNLTFSCDPIECLLEYESLSNIPRLGTSRRPFRSVPIYVNGRQISVGENLEAALRAMREIPEIRCGTRVWVDSLCISQNDAEEKAYEVKRMADIYMGGNKGHLVSRSR